MARWAVFDVDGTLLPGTSMEQLFALYLLKQGRIPLRNLFHFLIRAVRTVRTTRSLDGLKQEKVYFRGLPQLQIEQQAEVFFRERILPRLSTEGLDTVRTRRDQGFRILYLSGSPDFLLRGLQRHLPADYWLAATLEVQNGRFSGRLLKPHPYGQQKKLYLLELQSSLEIDFSQSVVYANHHSDVHHMELFAQAIAVNPTPRLQQIARQRGWPIVFWI
ncbi:MAG: HAD-IB family phosphatase [Calditrichaeota bacterium]|nr:HAD-IB family phosphatase [Calditrichota bacterium]